MVGISLGPPEMLVTLREVGELGLYLMLGLQDELILKILDPKW
jgi:hypothetical protein